MGRHRVGEFARRVVLSLSVYNLCIFAVLLVQFLLFHVGSRCEAILDDRIVALSIGIGNCYVICSLFASSFVFANNRQAIDCSFRKISASKRCLKSTEASRPVQWFNGVLCDEISFSDD